MEAMLFSQMEPRAGFESAFHHWYDTEHVPVRMALPGFLGARRYRAIEGRPAFLAIYDVVDTSVFQSAGFLDLRSNPSAQTRDMLGNVTGLTRYIGDEVYDSGPVLYGQTLLVTALDVAEPASGMLDDWCRKEYPPQAADQRACARARCYQIVNGGDRDWSHILLQEMATPDSADVAGSGKAWTALPHSQWVRKSSQWVYALIADVKASPPR